MAAPPKSVMKINKDGVKFESSVDFAQYNIYQLSRAAMKDVGKFVCRETRKKIKRRTGRVAKNTAWKVPFDKDLPHCEVGFKPGGFYGIFQELGTTEIPKVGALYTSVSDNIPMIIEIESQYLSALEDEARALSLIDESEMEGTEDE